MVGKPEGKRRLVRTRRRWEDITKVLIETAWFRVRKSEGPRRIRRLNVFVTPLNYPSVIKCIIVIM